MNSNSEMREMLVEIPEGLNNSGAIEIREKLGTISGGKVLDVATQKGGFIRTLMKALKDYSSFVGIDLLEENVRDARNDVKDAPITFQMMNAEMMEFADNEFDTVCMAHSIHHLENIDKVLGELYRVLRPGGQLILQESFSDGYQTEAQYVEIEAHTLDAEIDRLFNIPHFKTKTKQELVQIFNSIGVENSEILESSRYVKCLFCEDAPECEDPLNEGIVEFALKEMDEHLERIQDIPGTDGLKTRAEEIKDRIRTIGSTPASVLYFFGVK
jgi:ubiquinone/menaquinone biosynthesis C-methylase UbiE